MSAEDLDDEQQAQVMSMIARKIHETFPTRHILLVLMNDEGDLKQITNMTLDTFRETLRVLALLPEGIMEEPDGTLQ